MMIFVFVLLVAAFGTGLYLAIMYSSIPGAVDERLGTLEALPDSLGQWVVDTVSDAGKQAAIAGKVREVRTLHQGGGLFSREHFVVQVRLRNAETGEVESVESEQHVPRRRLKT
jgi:hypothetical protein